jgi:hypothetical protein
VSLHDFDQPFVFPLAFFDALELVPARTEGATRCMPQGADARFVLPGRIDQFLFQDTDDSVFAREDFADLVTMVPGGFNDATGGGVDHGCYST